MPLTPVTHRETELVRAFLHDADLTLAGLDDPAVRLWIERDSDDAVIGSTGYELSEDGQHVLIRSVAVSPSRRAAGSGSRLARFALGQAAQVGAERAWLLSRRSGPFWQKLGLAGADLSALAMALPDTQQVRLSTRTGQLDHEVAWSRDLSDPHRWRIRQ
ncbi:GNAT family N-acetyltransferase [Clavibacter michiganensis]|uniref:GNAT family N-acetyltransferase n=1 Tax=Clavibacter michiganensis TaxID=28447 RepID=UPI0021589BF4|nr:GNAT family N-acetyltransferase [Clavibacter michiganensis]